MNHTQSQLEVLKSKEMGTQPVELEVVRNGTEYRMVGVVMEVHDTGVRIAFSCKDEVVVDDLTLSMEEIQSMRFLEICDVQQLA